MRGEKLKHRDDKRKTRQKKTVRREVEWTDMLAKSKTSGRYTRSNDGPRYVKSYDHLG